MGRRRFATAQVFVILSAVVTALSQGAVREYGEKIKTEPPTGRNITYRCIGLQCIASDSNNNHFEAADSFVDPHQFDTMLYNVINNNGNRGRQAIECHPRTPYESCLPPGIGKCNTDSMNRDPYQCGRKRP